MRATACLIAIASLTACGSNVVDSAKGSVEQSLKDPASATFRNLKEVAGRTVCGEVNAKNSYGAFTGFKRFVSTDGLVTIDDGSTAGFDELWKACAV